MVVSKMIQEIKMIAIIGGIMGIMMGMNGGKVEGLTVGFYNATMDEQGNLVQQASYESTVNRLVTYYMKTCQKTSHGYPALVYNTFLNENCVGTNPQLIPGMHLGMGVISFLKYANFLQKENRIRTVQLGQSLYDYAMSMANKMGSYLVTESLTPQTGVFPGIVRSSGINLDFPLKTSAQADITFGVDCTEPDKAGIAGYALLQLYKATNNSMYFNMSYHIGSVLANAMRAGDANSSPFGFRVDSVTGEIYQSKSSNMVFILRLFYCLAPDF